MKSERLYAITVYLLNHGRTSAGELAKYFEVSMRTIQRDMDSLCSAGIPIISASGAAGGYEISKAFKLDREFATPDDYSYILTALQGLVSATGDRKAKYTLEKVSIMSKSNDNGLILDFSALREGNQSALQTLQALQTAVIKKRAVRFTYTNNNHETRTHTVEPIAVMYRWYAWYLLAYSTVKNEYRTYKLVRMSDLQIIDTLFTKKHEPAEIILKRTDQTDSRQYTEVLIKCSESVKARAVEYLKGTVMEELSNGDVLMKVTVVENEHFWLGTLLSFGNHAEIIAPENIRKRVIEFAENIVSLYK